MNFQLTQGLLLDRLRGADRRRHQRSCVLFPIPLFMLGSSVLSESTCQGLLRHGTTPVASLVLS